MPNWAEGSLKIRGKQKDVKRFLKENLIGEYSKPIQIEEKFDNLEIELKTEYSFYIKGTRRAFIDRSEIEVWFDDEEDDIVTQELTNFRQAWAAIPENYVELSKQYHLDFHIFTFEQGMQFTQEIEIINGKVTKNIEKEYDDYSWDVPFSTMGG